MKKLSALLLIIAALMLVCGISGAGAANAPCGNNLTWTLKNGTLTISGEGAMHDYTTGEDTPWYSYHESIVSVEILSGAKSIGKYAFYNCTSLTSVTIPDSVTSIGDSAFQYCISMKSISVPYGVTSIGKNTFYCCDSLTNINIPESVTSIGEDAFYYCASLTGVTLPDSLTSIGRDAFSHCHDLKSIWIPDGVTSIGDYAFTECSGLESVMIGDGVKSIGEYAFSECSGLMEVLIRNGVKSIGDYAFSGCRTLPQVVIPGSVTSIGNYAFQGCSTLMSIVIPDSVTSIGEGTFKDDDKVVIRANCASYAVTWAAANNTPYQASHILTGMVARGATCTEPGNSAFWTCKGCGKYFSDEAGKNGIAKDSWILPALGHSWGAPAYAWATDKATVTAKRACANDSAHTETETVETTYKVTKKPTYTAAGVGTYKTKPFTNTAFKAQTKKVSIAALPRTSISKATVKAIEDQVYTGSAIKPALTLKYSGKKLAQGTDYTVSFKDNVKPGKAMVTITGKNAFKGKTTVTFSILPKQVKLESLKAGKQKITVTWKKGDSITGYEIEYSLKKNFSASKTVTVSGATTVTTKIKNLKPGKTYYVRIRAFKKVGSKMYYSEWSDKMKAAVPAE